MGGPKVKQGQNPDKKTFFIVLHQTWASRSFLTTLTKFDLELTLGGPRHPNFDSTVRTGRNQCHCEDYQVLIPTTIHGSKSKLERSRYHENRGNTPIDAPLTSESHNFWSNRWIFKIHTFSKTRSQNISRGVKINPIHGILKVVALERLLPRKVCQGYKGPQAPFRPKKERSFSFLCFTWTFSAPFSSLSKSTQKTHQNILILLSLPKTQDIVLIPNLLLLGFTLWIWGLGVWM